MQFKFESQISQDCGKREPFMFRQNLHQPRWNGGRAERTSIEKRDEAETARPSSLP